MEILFNAGNLPWENHPAVKDVSIKKIITTQRFGKDSPSIIMVKIPVGVEVPEHVHEESEDILFILTGKATMWIDGIGKLKLQKNAVVRVPRDTKHRIFDVTDELLIYDVFSPGIM
ncbi:MAG: cupin domain-containing protein [Deltaproteobacteria bacterium]|nr:cupin domain-containing protein [Deltaproteobacteria bacterium]MBW2596407.1 cupin domain-containing protein [Deltaproteobacteria bacterium]